jgi:hypothetical protein
MCFRFSGRSDVVSRAPGRRFRGENRRRRRPASGPAGSTTRVLRDPVPAR